LKEVDVMHARALVPLFAAGLVGSTITLTVDQLAPWRASAQEAATLVQAQRFELVDASGAVRGGFGMADAGPRLTLNDASGQARVVLQQTPEGTYVIEMDDPNGTPRFAVGTTPREGGFVGLNVRDKSGAIRSRLFASDDGKRTGFQVQDPGPTLRAEMALNDGEGHVGFLVRDPGGATVWQAP
jgi:hypothetical protein